MQAPITGQVVRQAERCMCIGRRLSALLHWLLHWLCRGAHTLGGLAAAAACKLDWLQCSMTPDSSLWAAAAALGGGGGRRS